MASKVMELFERMSLEQKLRDKRLRMTAAGVAAAMLILISVVIRPAFTAEKVLVCTEAEHTHAEGCYTAEDIPACQRLGCNVSVHSHNEKCLDEKGVLICTKADYIIHTHNEYCRNGDTLVCTVPEKEGTAHTHTDACRDENGVLTCKLLETAVHNHSEKCIDASLSAQKQVLACTQAEHTHAEDCYTVIQKGEEIPAVSAADKTKSGSDISGTDSPAGTGNASPALPAVSATEPSAPAPEILSSATDMNVLFSTLLMSPAPQSDDGKTAITLGETVTFKVPGYTTDANYTFTPPYGHNYTVKYTYSNGYSTIKILDSNGSEINSTYTNKTVNVTLYGGEPYTFSLYNDYSSERTATITITRNDTEHVYVDGACGCGAEEPELSGTCGTGVTWSYKNGVLTISGTGNMTNYSAGYAPWYSDASVRNSIKKVVIEDGVTSIGKNAFYGCSGLTEIEIPESVTSISSYAFYNCTKLKEVEIPSGVTYINDSTFRNCDSLTTVVIPEGVKTIGSNAFYDCDGLTSIVIPDSVTTISSYVFYSCDNLKTVKLSENITSISSYLFQDCTSLESIEIPEKVTSIGGYAFRNCDSLTEIEIPDSVTSIGNLAFYDCDGLTSVVIPDSVTNLGTSVFSSCDNLKSAELNNTLTSIPNSTFSNCVSLESIDIPDCVTTIGSSAFYNCDSLTEIEIPETVTTIGSYAFYDCDGLTSVAVPDSVTTINSYAFSGCDNLKSVDLSENITTISSSLFSGCKSLESIDIPDGVTSIGSEAFNNCDALTEIEIPEGVTSIGNKAFYDCDGLTSVVIPDSVTSFGTEVFTECNNLKSVEIGSGITKIPDHTFKNCKSLESVIMHEGITSIGNSAFYNCDALTEVEIPDSVTSIGNSAFYDCDGLTSVVIPDSVTTLGTSVFYSCDNLKSAELGDGITSIPGSTFYSCKSLESIDIPDGVTSIGSDAFNNCDALTTVVIPESVTSVGSSAFYGCDGLVEAVIKGDLTTVGSGVFYNCDKLEHVVMEDGVTIIGPYMFKDCAALKSVEIPDSVTTISSEAFRNCDSLTEVVISENVTTLGDYAFYDADKLEKVTINADLETLGAYAFCDTDKLKEVTINGDIETIDKYAFYDTPIEKLAINGDVKNIGDYAFYSVNVKELDLPDSVETIGNCAFYNCDNVLSLTLPSELKSIGTNGFASCDGLTELTLDSKELTTVASNAFSSNKALEKLTVTDNVDVLSAQFIDSLSSVGSVLDNVAFEGENYLTIEKGFGKDYPLAAGDYYVDENGALYLLDKEKGTATLARIPEGITEYTVPGTIPSETDGGTYKVVGVEPNALKTAADLTVIEFEKPENVTYLPAGSCSNCPTLESVNGEITVDGAYSIFTNEDLVKYDYVFYNTGLEDNGEKTDEEIFIYGNDSDLIPLIKIITGKNDGTNNEDFNGTYTYYTGETAKLTIGISNANAGDYDSVRVYVAFDDDGGQMSWPLGNHSVQTNTGKTYNLKIAESDVKNVYYIECDRIDVGDTVSANLTLSFPSPTTGGGKARIWPVVLDEGEKEKIGNGVVPGESFNEVEWLTKVDDFSLTKSHYNRSSYTSGTGIASKGSDGRVYLYNLNYKVTQNRKGDTLLGIGKDHMESVDFTDVLRLPEGVYWHEDVIEAVKNGTYEVSGTSPVYIYANVDGVRRRICHISCSSQTAEYIIGSMRLEVTDEGDIAMFWSYRNKSVDTTEMNNIEATIYFDSEISKSYTRQSYTYTDYQTFICVDNAYLEEKLILHNDVDTVQHFCYSEDQTDHAEVERTIDAGTTDFLVTKSKNAYSYWGDRYEYTVGLKNPYGHDYPGIYQMYDPMPDEIYIRPADMQTMFDEAVADKDRIKSLTIEISRATLCNDTAESYTPGAPAVGTDSSSHTLVQNNTGTGTQYSGLEMTDPAEYATDATLVLTCTTADGKQTLSYNGSVLDATDIASALEAVGYVVTRNARYTVTWDLADDFILESGEQYTKKIYSRSKDTFMMISDDEWNNADSSQEYVDNNYVYARYMKDGNSAQKSAYASYGYIYREFWLYKNYSISGVSDAEVAETGDIIDYTITVKHSTSNTTYDMLPLTDHMTGGQVMLVPAEGNDHLAAQGLSTVDVDGVSYYSINKVGVYRNVLVSDRVTDSITVTQMEGGGFDTLIRWNLHDITASCTKYIGYKAMVDPASTGVTAMQFGLDNETWLNDHQTHRLYDTIGGEGYAVTGTQIAFDKYIVTEKGATPDEDALAVYSRFEEGQTTTYRLSLTNLSEDGVVNINGNYIYDSLPKTRHEVFKWEKENMTMTFVPAKEGDFSFTFDGSLDSAWYIDYAAPLWTGIGEHEDQQWIRWSDGFTIHLKGTVYIYVTITMPEDETWVDNAIKYRETVLENSFYVYEEKATVTHDLAIQAEAYLQKSVVGTGPRLYSNYMSSNKNDDARWHYINSGAKTELVEYYIVLYNSGHTRLYLNPIQDYLPQGFSVYVNGSNYGTITSPRLNVYDNEGNKLSPVWKSANTSRTCDGRKITFTLTDNTGGTSIKRDPFYDKCYLAPNEAVCIYYYAKVGARGTTEEVATNYTAMPYFDYLGQGVVKGDVDMELPSNYISGTNQKPNDGTCSIIDTANAGNIGMTGGSIGTQWLESHVTLTPGEIVPGITKWVEKITRTNGQVSTDKETAGSEDTVTWKVKMTNTGTDNLVNYTFTDVMNADYGFVGDVRISRTYDNLQNNAYSGEMSNQLLFTVIRDDEDLDKIAIEYIYNSSSNKKTVELIRNGEAVSIKPYLKDYSNNSTNTEAKVRIRTDENNNEILEVEMIGEFLLIPSYGSVTMELSTKNYGTWENKVYYNNAYLTPNIQSYDPELVSQGNHLLFGDEQRPSVRNSAQITAAYGYVTTSEKRIREIGNETNCASSKDEKNWIFLDEHEDLFRYTNIVNNVTGKPLSKFIMIDNLPEVGDHETFADTEPRYSAFKVELTEDPKFEVAMVLDDSRTVLTSDQYEVMFSDRTEFDEKDWDDSSDDGWYTSPKKSTRSFRLSIYDETGLVIPDKASIQVEYNGRIIMADDYDNDEVTTDPVEGTIAWNSFGYHYRVHGESISLEAAPLKVGICIKYIPIMQKSLVYPDGTAYTAAEDESFRFLIYSGSAISSIQGKTEAQIGQLLKNNGRNAMLVTINVKAGQNISDELVLSDAKKAEYDSTTGTWKETGDWSFMDGDTYTVYELENPDSMFKFRTLGGSGANSYTFTFEGMKQARISGVNVRKTWSARINKVDAAEGKPLAGAYFGIYTLSDREVMSDDDYQALTLRKKPARFITHGGKTWALSKVCESDSSGTALFTGLIEDEYVVRELQAPGGYKLEKDIHSFSLDNTDESLVDEKQVVNEADYELPKTGTKEASAMMVWGNVLMLIAFAVLAVRKNFFKEEQN